MLRLASRIHQNNSGDFTLLEEPTLVAYTGFRQSGQDGVLIEFSFEVRSAALAQNGPAVQFFYVHSRPAVLTPLPIPGSYFRGVSPRYFSQSSQKSWTYSLNLRDKHGNRASIGWQIYFPAVSAKAVLAGTPVLPPKP